MVEKSKPTTRNKPIIILFILFEIALISGVLFYLSTLNADKQIESKQTEIKQVPAATQIIPVKDPPQPQRINNSEKVITEGVDVKIITANESEIIQNTTLKPGERWIKIDPNATTQRVD